MRFSTLALCTALVAAAPLVAQEKGIDTQRSIITIHVGKSGTVVSCRPQPYHQRADILWHHPGVSPPHIEFTIETSKMTVEPGPPGSTRKIRQRSKHIWRR